MRNSILISGKFFDKIDFTNIRAKISEASSFRIEYIKQESTEMEVANRAMMLSSDSIFEILIDSDLNIKNSEFFNNLNMQSTKIEIVKL